MAERSARRCLSILVFSSLLLGGCETVMISSTTGMPLPPPPERAPTTPADANVTNVVAISPYSMNFEEGDNNGSDFPIAVYLYAQPHPSPKWQAGTFTLALYEFGQVPDEIDLDETQATLALRTWNVEQSMGARDRSIVGDFYRFEIDLTNEEFKPTEERMVEYRICFTPESGAPPVYSPVKTIRAR